jgi:multiple antibiotic resistance protein
MEHSAVPFSTVLMAFFAIMNPIANAPLFVGLTSELDTATRRSVAVRAVLLAFLIVAVFAIAGQSIFHLFGITLPAFRIAGGALIGLVGYHMLQGEGSSVHHPSAGDRAAVEGSAIGIAVSPLALPVLAGPGTIATAMSFAAEGTAPELIRVLGALAVICAVTLVAFFAGEPLLRTLGQNAIKVVTRLMGLILAVIGVQMLISGIEGAVKSAGSL